MKEINFSLIIRSDDGIFSGELIKILNNVDNGIIEAEIKEFERCAMKCAEEKIPVEIKTSEFIKYAKKEKGNIIKIRKAKSGSIILYGVLKGLVALFLRVTVFKSIEDAYVETDMHKQIKKIFKTNIPDKMKSIGEEIINQFRSQEIEIITIKRNEFDNEVIDLEILINKEKEKEKR